MFFLSQLPTKNKNIAEIIIRKGPTPGYINPKLDINFEGSSTPERIGVTQIKINPIVGYINFSIAEIIGLMKFKFELIIADIKKIIVKRDAISPKNLSKVYKLLKKYMCERVTPPLSYT
ncbi:unnamed protein product, partial [marine sediment metagenome]